MLFSLRCSGDFKIKLPVHRSVDAIIQMLKDGGQQPIATAEGVAAARRVGAACYIETSPEIEKNIRKLLNNAIASVLDVRGADSSSCSIL